MYYICVNEQDRAKRYNPYYFTKIPIQSDFHENNYNKRKTDQSIFLPKLPANP
jgi:hypothetical protein